jgi:hypothetical protein
LVHCPGAGIAQHGTGTKAKRFGNDKKSEIILNKWMINKNKNYRGTQECEAFCG